MGHELNVGKSVICNNRIYLFFTDYTFPQIKLLRTSVVVVVVVVVVKINYNKNLKIIHMYNV